MRERTASLGFKDKGVVAIVPKADFAEINWEH